MGAWCVETRERGPIIKQVKPPEAYDVLIQTSILRKQHLKQNIKGLIDQIENKCSATIIDVPKPASWVTQPASISSLATCYLYDYFKDFSKVKLPANKKIIRDTELIQRIVYNLKCFINDISEGSAWLLFVLARYNQDRFILDNVYYPESLQTIFDNIVFTKEESKVLLSRVIRNCYADFPAGSERIRPFLKSYISLIPTFRRIRNCIDHVWNVMDFYIVNGKFQQNNFDNLIQEGFGTEMNSLNIEKFDSYWYTKNDKETMIKLKSYVRDNTIDELEYKKLRSEYHTDFILS